MRRNMASYPYFPFLSGVLEKWGEIWPVIPVSPSYLEYWRNEEKYGQLSLFPLLIWSTGEMRRNMASYPYFPFLSGVLEKGGEIWPVIPVSPSYLEYRRNEEKYGQLSLFPLLIWSTGEMRRNMASYSCFPFLSGVLEK